MMQKMVTRNIRDETLAHVLYIYKNLPTNQGSTQKPQCIMWLQIYREQWKTGRYTWAFLDIERASYSTLWHNKGCQIEWTADTLHWWIGCMLGGRKRTSTPTGETLEGFFLAKCCLQRVILSIAMMPGCCWTPKWTQKWLLYTGVCAIVISGKFPNSVSHLL
jgi:hypothetical protein